MPSNFETQFHGTLQSAAALLTPRGRGAVATIRFRGDCRLLDQADPPAFLAANGRALEQQPLNRIVFGRWGRDPVEEVVLCRIDEQSVEIHCHGGDAAVRRVLADLESLGCIITTWQEMSQHAAGVLETECLDALSRAKTLRTATILLEQYSGVLRAAFEDLQVSNLKSVSGRREAYPTGRIDALLTWADFGLHLTRPWSVVLGGRPNVGKSSLINALVGYARSIVYDEPGTTRDVVTAETALDGWPIELTDTAGLRDDADELESAGIALARERLLAADCRVLLLDTSRPPTESDRRLLAEWPRAVVVAHKCDLPNMWAGELPAGAIRASSRTSEGVNEVARQIAARLVPEVPASGTAIPVTGRQVELLTEARAALASADSAAFVALFNRLLGVGRSRD
jgi:tRNA modification GTPase